VALPPKPEPEPEPVHVDMAKMRVDVWLIFHLFKSLYIYTQ